MRPNYKITQGVRKASILRRNETMFIPWEKENKLLTVRLKCTLLRKHLLPSNLTRNKILIVRKKSNDKRNHALASNFRKMSKCGSLYLLYFLCENFIFIHKGTQFTTAKDFKYRQRTEKKFRTFFIFVLFVRMNE